MLPTIGLRRIIEEIASGELNSPLRSRVGSPRVAMPCKLARERVWCSLPSLFSELRETVDIFSFWSECPADARVHPRDAPVFERAGDMGFNLQCLPSNVWGTLKTARVVLLFLSPGFDEWDLAYAEQPSSHALFARRRQGIEPLDSKEEHPKAWQWLASRTKAFGTPAELRDRLAILNIGAYHSKTFNDDHALMALPSSRASIDWAQAVLFPEAERGERVVVCLRKARAWGLTRGKPNPGTLFAPLVNAAGYMVKGAGREMIATAARKAMGLS
jgi:hypothetical protein